MRKYQQHSFNDRGQAILEFVTVLPLLVMFTFALVDVGRALQQYYRITYVVQQSVRHGSLLGGLEEGQFDSFQTTYPERQELLRTRIKDLLVRTGFSLNRTRITTEYIRDNTLIPEQINTVSVLIEAQYSPLFGYPLFTLKSQALGPYLYQDPDA